MVAQNIRLPNIRRIFVPDPGYVIVDADLAGADAQVVAWEAGDEKLKTAFKQGLKIHIMNARDMWPERTANMTDKEIKATGDSGGLYYEIKRAVHGTNYGASPNALVAILGWTRAKAEGFQEKWFYLHPEIKGWHLRVERYLDGTQCWNCDNLELTFGKACPVCGTRPGRTVKNSFGFRRRYFDRLDGQILPQALAWNPQSTVAFAIDIGWVSLSQGTEFLTQFSHAEATMASWEKWLVQPKAHSKWGHVVQFLLQVHDSIVFQVPYEYEQDIPEIVADLQVNIPYPDPLVIPLSHAISRSSWGDCK